MARGGTFQQSQKKKKPCYDSYRSFHEKKYTGKKAPKEQKPLDWKVDLTDNDMRTLYATFNQPQADNTDIYSFFMSKFGNIVEYVKIEEHEQLCAWIRYYTAEMAAAVLREGKGTLPVKFFMTGSKSIWLKPSWV